MATPISTRKTTGRVCVQSIIAILLRQTPDWAVSGRQAAGCVGPHWIFLFLGRFNFRRRTPTRTSATPGSRRAVKEAATAASPARTAPVTARNRQLSWVTSHPDEGGGEGRPYDTDIGPVLPPTPPFGLARDRDPPRAGRKGSRWWQGGRRNREGRLMAASSVQRRRTHGVMREASVGTPCSPHEFVNLSSSEEHEFRLNFKWVP